MYICLGYFSLNSLFDMPNMWTYNVVRIKMSGIYLILLKSI